MEIRRSISDLHEKLIKTINGIQLKAAATITFPFSLACFLSLAVPVVKCIFNWDYFHLPPVWPATVSWLICISRTRCTNVSRSFGSPVSEMAANI